MMQPSSEKQERLSRSELHEILKEARLMCRHFFCDIKAAPAASIPSRVIVVTPKKVGSAPYRNLLKRRVRSIFREEKFFSAPWHWVIFFRPTQEILDFKVIQTAMRSCHSKLIGITSSSTGSAQQSN